MRARLRSAWRALRGFVIGFTGMPAPRLDRCGTECEVRHALAERAGRRPSCC